ncbi:carbon-monoxide dehydrogenase large subunit [Roseomonas rosea]|uniref:Carbon-monoxide dehydrogenase large subunit n=1 Tax=Muricoccus roseus TaxID=198092 RepID=A0A1M6SAV0_9PROT|nr:xanthine dehydrogenase family protein molybdopterin-binding subunit [Roseomonas rosea]SHK41831.1 carbon-monoxide dehydrogenase large subunit [Roseomonas rosea]
MKGGTGIGASVRRREDRRFLTGRGRYVADLERPGMLHAFFLRSPHAHARLLALDLAPALAMPGVVAAFGGAALQADGVLTIPTGWKVTGTDGRPMAEPLHPPLVLDRARHVGEPVAVVIARDARQARDAAERLDPEWEVLSAVTDSAAALAPGAPALFDDVPGNLCCDWSLGDTATVEAAFARAQHVTRLSLTNNRLVPHPMEPRAALAEHDPGTGQTILHTTSQNPHTIRSTLANSVLRIPESLLRVVSPDVGGGFGTKIFLYPEETVLTWAARRLGASIRWVGDRSEAFLTDVQGRDHRTEAELALDAEGRFIGLRVDTLANLGAYLSGAGAGIPTYYYAPLLAGVYRTPAIHCRVRLAFTNTVQVDAYRGAGRPEATYVLERLVDQAARETGRDRVALRRLNFIRPGDFPYRTPVGLEYDVGDHGACLDAALAASGFAGFEERRREAAARGKLRGLGVSTYVEIAGATPSRVAGQQGARGGRAESAQLRVHPGGDVTVFSGAHSHGQGHETVFAQIVSERLGVPIDRVQVVQGDTAQVPFGRGTAASRSLVVGGSAILRAVEKVVTKGRQIAAHLMEASEADLVLQDGHFAVAGTDRVISFQEVARAAYTLHDYPTGLEPGLDETAFYEPENWTFPGGCHIAEVEIDPEVGEVGLVAVTAADDVGNVINPLIVDGQIHGGLAQGMGQALLEELPYDGTGQPLAASLQDYCLPRAGDLPSYTVVMCPTPSPGNAFGAKGCAEVGSVGLPPAIINAVLDALGPLGVTDIDMPVTPQKVWKAIKTAALPG